MPGTDKNEFFSLLFFSSFLSIIWITIINDDAPRFKVIFAVIALLDDYDIRFGTTTTSSLKSLLWHPFRSRKRWTILISSLHNRRTLQISYEIG